MSISHFPSYICVRLLINGLLNLGFRNICSVRSFLWEETLFLLVWYIAHCMLPLWKVLIFLLYSLISCITTTLRSFLVTLMLISYLLQTMPSFFDLLSRKTHYTQCPMGRYAIRHVRILGSIFASLTPLIQSPHSGNPIVPL